MLEIICVVSFVTLCLCLSSIKFLKDYERLVIFQIGRVKSVRGPGPQIVWPFIETYKKFDLRIMSLPIEGVEIIARDHVPVSVSAVCYYQVADPKKTVLHVDDYRDATGHAVEAVFKNVLKSYQSSELLVVDRRILKALKAQIEPTVSTWGVRVTEFTISINGATATTSVSEPIGSSETVEPVSAVLNREQGSSVESMAYEHHLNHEHAHHPKHKHTHYSFGHDSYDFGHHSYEFGHDKKSE